MLSLAVLNPAAVSAADSGPKPARGWAQSIVTLDITRRQYDYFQPWSQHSQTINKSGVVIGPREILTTADDLDDRTLVRVQKGGRGQWSPAEVKWVDHPANIAIVTSPEDRFWEGLKPVRLADRIARDASLQVLRWRGGNLENRRAEFNRFTLGHGNLSDTDHVVMDVGSEIEGTGWAEPVVAGNKLVGLVTSQTGNTIQVLPAPFILSILEAQRKNTFKGLGYFDFTWESGENPDTFEYLRLPGEPRGGIVIEVPKKPGVEPALKPRDILLQVDGFDIDNQGDYVDPLYGHLLLENLATRNKSAGDKVRLKVWRDGAAKDVIYQLPDAQRAARLVPEDPFDGPPQYLVMGGLVFQPLTKNYLRGWGQDWQRRAPFRLAFFRNEEPTPERPAIVTLSQVLPDVYNVGYSEARQLVVDRVNGRKISYLAELREALKSPVDGFHVIEFMKGESLQKIVLDAAQEPAATKRVLDRYGIESDAVITPRS